ncbi:MAG: LamG domain-containing protein [Candidatus Poribacteria bacterium]|nr:LamG domain-containing protein [Candidatus Poribacteria bacterium]
MRATLDLFLKATVIALVAGIGFAAVAQDDSLSLYLSFDEGAGEIANDGSKYGNHATVVGDPKWEKNGNIGGAVVLATNTWVDLHGPDFKNIPTEGITLATWINYNGALPQSLFDAIGDVNVNGLYHVEIEAAGMRWFHRNDANVDVFAIRPGPVIPADTWTHFAGTYDVASGAVRAYLNGKKTHEAVGAGDMEDNWNLSAEIGQHKMTRWFNGMVDEFYLFNRALDETEIAALMNSEGLSVEPSGKLPLMWGKLKQR